MLLGPLLSGGMSLSLSLFSPFSPLFDNDNNNKLTNPLFLLQKKLGLHQLIGYSNMESVLGESTNPLLPPLFFFPVQKKNLRGRINANQRAGVYSCVMFMFCSACAFLFETESIVYTKE